MTLLPPIFDLMFLLLNEIYFCSQVSVIIKHFDCEQLNWLFVIHNLQ